MSFLSEAVEASWCYFFEKKFMKLKFPNPLKPLDTIIQQNYWSFYPSQMIYFALFNMRHPVYVHFPGPPYSLSRVVFCQLTAFTFSTSFIKLGAWATAKFINSFDTMAHWEFPKNTMSSKNFQFAFIHKIFLGCDLKEFHPQPQRVLGKKTKLAVFPALLSST